MTDDVRGESSIVTAQMHVGRTREPAVPKSTEGFPVPYALICLRRQTWHKQKYFVNNSSTQARSDFRFLSTDPFLGSFVSCHVHACTHALSHPSGYIHPLVLPTSNETLTCHFLSFFLYLAQAVYTRPGIIIQLAASAYVHPSRRGAAIRRYRNNALRQMVSSSIKKPSLKLV